MWECELVIFGKRKVRVLEKNFLLFVGERRVKD